MYQFILNEILMKILTSRDKISVTEIWSLLLNKGQTLPRMLQVCLACKSKSKCPSKLTYFQRSAKLA